MKKALMLLATTSCLSAPAIAADTDPYEYCNDILAQGVFDNYNRTMNFNSKVALKKWLCSSDESSSNAGGNLKFSVMKIFSLGGGGGNVKSWKRQHCEGSDYEYEGSGSSHVLIQQANDTIVNAWSSCMKEVKRDNLVCYAKETDDSLLMTVDLEYGIGNIENVEINSTNLTALTSEPTRIRPGEKRIRYQKDNERREGYFDLNGEADYIDVSCSYTIPKKPVAENNEGACEVFRLQALSDGMISPRDYQHYRDNAMVPLFDNRTGHLAGYYRCSRFNEY
ncbi:hypothetical protein [Algicola sagamiensis]|uniref:hypothetical protein n=1 Tax=Algicola sagamiensis TaxID=163869 RepID=UPI0003A3658A|nr:hypothetical protein [Algicola sagamiensis]